MSMKLKRDEFKSMLKECILELVQEGKLFQGALPSASGQQVSGQMGEQASEGTPNQQFLNEVNNTAAQMARGIAKGDAKKNSMYQSIIADTARTTLQAQRAAEFGLNGDAMMTESMMTPEDKAFDNAQLGVFQAKSRWAQLAFGNKAKNPNGS